MTETNEQQILAAIRKKYPADRFAFFPGLRNSTGYASTVRTADAVVMSLWPSRGLDIIGFEVKVSRGDWFRELKNPEKAEEIMQFCDQWYVVTATHDLIRDDELPSTWGWMVLHGKQLRVKVKAPKLDPQTIDRPFLASVLRNAQSSYVNWIPKAQIQAETDAAYEEGRERERSAHKTETRLKAGYEEIIEKFYEATGVHLATWNAEKVGHAVKLVMEGKANVQSIASDICHISTIAKRLAIKARQAEREARHAG